MSAVPSNEAQSNSAEPGKPELRIWSCVICRRRKVRCDRHDPCSNCTKNNIECHFPVTGRLPRRSRDPASSSQKSPSQRQSELIGRLRRLEAVVTELTAQVEDGSGKEPGQSAFPAASYMNLPTPIGSTDVPVSEAGAYSDRPSIMPSMGSVVDKAAETHGQTLGVGELDEDFGALVIDEGNGLHIGKGFWTIFCSEVDNIFQAVQDVAAADGDEMPGHALDHENWSRQHKDLLQRQATQSLVFGRTPDTGLDDSLYPLPSQMLFIWQTFTDRVDPFVKILHNPSINQIVQNLRGSFRFLGPDMEALFFAISFASIMSLEDDEVMVNFARPKAELLDRFRRGTEMALTQASLLVTKEMTVVRAFAIYLSILPHLGEEAQKVVHPLIGLLERIATSAGLYHDAASLQSSWNDDVFKAEMNCRLQWQICFIDSQAHNTVSNLAPSSTAAQTQRPTNVDDIELGSISSYESLQIPRARSTDMTLCLIRCELRQLSHSLKSSNSETVDVHLDILNKTRLRIKNTYLQYLDLEISDFDSFIKVMTELFFARVEQVIYRQNLQQSAKTTYEGTLALNQNVIDRLLTSSILIIAALHRLKKEPAWRKWRWHFQGHIPWYAMGSVLSHICDRPWTAEFERAWLSTKRMFDALPGDAKKESMWQPLNQLVAYIEKRREQNLARTAMAAPNDTETLYNTSDDNETMDSASMIGQVLADQEDSFDTADQTTYVMDAMPMDWQAWEDLAGSESLWNFSEF